jgi:very-short-patch-repair endonuclease
MESPFEEAVAAQLERRGWQVVPQVGVSGYRIDLGIKHPDHPGIYLAGIECDGATYHSSATARDRDKVREQVLRGLGWTILRVWSTDWWFSAEEAIERVHQTLDETLAESRAAAARAAESDASTVADTPIDDESEEAAVTDRDVFTVEPDIAQTIDDNDLAGIPIGARSEIGERQVASSGARGAESAAGVFAIADLSAFKADPDLFFEFSYRPTIQAMVDAVMNAEAPVRDDVLAQRVARAHGWLRTGARIREQIALHLRKLERTSETTGTFLWKPGTVAERLPFRKPLGPNHRRSLAEIATAELTDFVLTHPAALDEEDPPLVYARLMQVDRLAAPSRDRIAEAIARARMLGADAS